MSRYSGDIGTEYRMVEAARRYYPDTVMIVQVIGTPCWLAFDTDADTLHLHCVTRRTAYGYGSTAYRLYRRYATLDAADLARVIGQATTAGHKVAVLGDVPAHILRQSQSPQRSLPKQCELAWPI